MWDAWSHVCFMNGVDSGDVDQLHQSRVFDHHYGRDGPTKIQTIANGELIFHPISLRGLYGYASGNRSAHRRNFSWDNLGTEIDNGCSFIVDVGHRQIVYPVPKRLVGGDSKGPLNLGQDHPKVAHDNQIAVRAKCVN